MKVMERKRVDSALIILAFLFMLPFFNIQEVAADSQQWSDSHNGYRSLHQVGNVTWSAKIAANAQAWANTCPSGHSSSSYGENIAFASYIMTPAQVVQLWYDEEPLYDYNNPGFSMNTGHFTQVVWKNTTEIGCGFKSGCGGTYSNIWVCQYNPPGNYLGQFAENVFPKTSQTQSWPEPATLCNGWCYTWMGWVNDEWYPWVYHYNFGWLYVTGNSTNLLIWNHNNNGYWWTSNTYFPWFWFYNENYWFWNYKDTNWFYDYYSGAWVTR